MNSMPVKEGDAMKINKEKLMEMAKLEDSELWREIRNEAAKFGYSLPEKTPSPEEMAKIKSIMKNADKISAGDVLKLMSAFKGRKV